MSEMISKVEDRDLIIERVFDAPRELVFSMFKEPEHLVHWWGPKGWTLPVCNIDFRPGGTWHYCMRSEDGQMESWGRGDYEEIDEPERIVYVDSFSDADGTINESMPRTRVTLTFVEEDGKTRLINAATYATAEALQSVIDMGMLQGITETWDRLEERLQQVR